jgi:hypothetical protein
MTRSSPASRHDQHLGGLFWASETASGWWTAQAEKNSLAVGLLFLTVKPRVRANPETASEQIPELLSSNSETVYGFAPDVQSYLQDMPLLNI